MVLFAGLHKLHGMDFQITGREMELHFAAEYNRAFLFCWDVAATKTLNLNAKHDVRAGVALGMVGDILELKWFAGGTLAPFANVPVRFTAAYIHNGLPAYGYRCDTLRLVTYFERGRWGVALGPAFRFRSFFGESGIFEPVLSWAFHVFAVNRDTLRMGAGIANFDDFVSRNMGGHFFNVNVLVRLSPSIALVNELRIYQSGSFVLASNFYGVAYRGGLLFSW